MGGRPFLASSTNPLIVSAKPLFSLGAAVVVAVKGPGALGAACAFLIPCAQAPYQIWITATPPQMVERVLPGATTSAWINELQRAEGARDVLAVRREDAEETMKRIAICCRMVLL